MARGMIVDNEYDIGETVYIKTDADQSPRIVTCIMIYPGVNHIAYRCACGVSESSHYGFELSKEPRLEGVKI